MTAATQTVRQHARRASDSRWLDLLARVGLVGRGIVYALIAVLAFQIAFGDHSERADQTGAFQTLAQNGAGKALLWLVVAGFVGYAGWQLAEAIRGHRHAEPKKRTGKRIESGVKAAVYFGLAGLAAKTAVGSGGGGGGDTASAKLMGATGGRILVGLVGAVLVGVGVAMAAKGIKRSFTEEMELGRLQQRTRRAVVGLGAVGHTARGVVVGLVGGLVIAAAVTVDPEKARGFDAALKALAGQPAGPWLLCIAAAGLICFGAFSVIDARYHRL